MPSIVLRTTDLSIASSSGNWSSAARVCDGSWSLAAIGTRTSESGLVLLQVAVSLAALPPMARLTGFEWYWRIGFVGGSGWSDPGARVVLNGAGGGVKVFTMPSTDTYQTLGGAADVWGHTAANLASPSSLAMRMQASYGFPETHTHGFYIYEVELKVFYENTFNPIMAGANF